MSVEVGQPEQPINNSQLLTRLGSYSLVNSAIGYYQTIKDASPLAKTGIEFAENVAKRGIQVAAPVIQKVEAYTHVDERSAALLGAIETQAATLNTVAHQPLDTLLDVLDRYLPSDANRVEFDEDAQSVEKLKDPHSLTPVAKIRFIGERVGRASVTKLRELQLRGPHHQEAMQNITELVQYASGILHLSNVGDSISTRINDAQHILFNQAAKAATNVHEFASRSPTYVAFEKALEPKLKTVKTVTEKQLIVVIAAVGSAVDLTSHFFANTKANITEIVTNAVERSTAYLHQLQEAHPDANKIVVQFIDGIKSLFSDARAIATNIAQGQLNSVSHLYSQMFNILEAIEAHVNTYMATIMQQRKKDEIELDMMAENQDEEVVEEQANEHQEQHEEHHQEQNKQQVHHNNHHHHKGKGKGKKGKH